MRKVLGIVRHIQDSIKLVRWNPRDYHRKFGKRTIGEVMESRETNYMNPCPDQLAATVLLLKEAGLRPKLVVQELIGEYTGRPTFHLAAEVPIDGGVHTIDFKMARTVLVYRGRYSVRKSNPEHKNLGVRRFSTRRLDRSTTMLGLLGISSYKELGTRFKHMNRSHLRAIFGAMKRADSPQLLREVRRRRPEIRRL